MLPRVQSGVVPEDRLRLREAHSKRVALFTALRNNADTSVKTWDVVVLLVQDEDQQRQFEEDLKRREKMGKIPSGSKYHVIPDNAQRCGNGGAIINTLAVLSGMYSEKELDEFKVLLLPCGGATNPQRLPQVSIVIVAP